MEQIELSKPTTLSDDALIVMGNVADYATDLITPTIRLGVTGLSRAGKTVFITALIQNLVNGGRLPLFSPMAQGRITSATVTPLAAGTVPEFDYRTHLADLQDQRVWPASTRSISEIRITVHYESQSFFARQFGSGKLHIDIVDYPGEWLLDLPLLTKSYAEWSAEALLLSRQPHRAALAEALHGELAKVDPMAEGPDTEVVHRLASHFTDYLRAARQDKYALSLLPPGRFLMPGDMEGSPALSFAPLELPVGSRWSKNSLAGLMESRFEDYKDSVIRPFFRRHFVRLDRQVVLVDALNATNAGPAALHDLELALGEILSCFRPGTNSWLSRILTRKIDRILFAATKADHVHQSDHGKLQSILSRLVGNAKQRAHFSGAATQAIALSSVRATQEAVAEVDGDTLPALVGTPAKGQQIDGQTCDGETEFAIFPGDLPESVDELFPTDPQQTPPPVAPLNFIRFRPPLRDPESKAALPHIRLDRALEFLLGDKLA